MSYLHVIPLVDYSTRARILGDLFRHLSTSWIRIRASQGTGCICDARARAGVCVT